MEFLPVIDNIHIEGTVSHIFDMVFRFDFITKNGKHFVIFCYHSFFISYNEK